METDNTISGWQHQCFLGLLKNSSGASYLNQIKGKGLTVCPQLTSTPGLSPRSLLGYTATVPISELCAFSPYVPVSVTRLLSLFYSSVASSFLIPGLTFAPYIPMLILFPSPEHLLHSCILSRSPSLYHPGGGGGMISRSRCVETRGGLGLSSPVALYFIWWRQGLPPNLEFASGPVNPGNCLPPQCLVHPAFPRVLGIPAQILLAQLALSLLSYLHFPH